DKLVPNGPAARAGVEVGSRVLAVSDEEGKMVSTEGMKSLGEYTRYGRGRPGTSVRIKLRRGEGPEVAREITRERIPRLTVHRLTFSPNGAWLAGDVSGTVYLWDVQAGAGRALLHRNAVLAFTPDGRRLLAGHSDGSAAVLDVEGGELVCVLEG